MSLHYGWVFAQESFSSCMLLRGFRSKRGWPSRKAKSTTQALKEGKSRARTWRWKKSRTFWKVPSGSCGKFPIFSKSGKNRMAASATPIFRRCVFAYFLHTKIWGKGKDQTCRPAGSVGPQCNSGTASRPSVLHQKQSLDVQLVFIIVIIARARAGEKMRLFPWVFSQKCWFTHLEVPSPPKADLPSAAPGKLDRKLQNQPTHRWRLKASDACILSATPLMLEDWMRKRRNQKSS